MLRLAVRLKLIAVILSSAVVVFVLGFGAGFVTGDPARRDILLSKLTGRLPHRSILETIRFIAPRGLPGPLGHLPSIHAEERTSGACPVLWKTPIGFFRGRESDHDLLIFLMREQFFRGIYERDPVLVRREDVVLDAGANLGTFTRYALSRGAARVIAVEPEPVNIQCFKSSFDSELKAGKVVLVEAALWDRSGPLQFEVPREGNSGMGRVQRDPHLPSITVPAVTIDELAEKLELPRVDFIKMDIEGSERYALRGGQRTIAQFKPRMSLSVEHLVDDVHVITRTVLELQPRYSVLAGESVLHFH